MGLEDKDCILPDASQVLQGELQGKIRNDRVSEERALIEPASRSEINLAELFDDDDDKDEDSEDNPSSTVSDKRTPIGPQALLK